MRSGFMNRKPGTLYSMVLGALFLAMPLVPDADDQVADDLARCSSIDDASARLACYDGLSGRSELARDSSGATAESSPAPVAAPVPKAVQTSQKALDDLGSETLPRKKGEDLKELSVRATVTRCQKDASKKKYFFYFDNGQVWKQLSDKRVFFKDCNFEVTITKDFFGYKMQKDGEKARLRISRIK